MEAIIGGGGIYSGCKPGEPSLVPDSYATPPQSPFKSILPGAGPRTRIQEPLDLPWRNVGLLNFFNSGRVVTVGTGFLSEPDVLLTARHNLTARPYDAVGLWFGYDAKLNPNTPAVGIRAFAFHRDLDLALFILETPQQSAFILASPALPATLTLAGYAMPYPDGTVRFTSGNGPLNSVRDSLITYGINTREGDSGAPVIRSLDGTSVAVGLHIESADSVLLGNQGLAFSQDVMDDIAQLAEWARQQGEL